MRSVRDLGYALTIALVSVGLMVGALSISLVEFVPEANPTATSNVLPSPLPVTATATIPPTETLLPTLTATFSAVSPTPTITLTSTITSTPPVNCPSIPRNWMSIIVQSGDTLDSLGRRYNVSANDLMHSNCLFSSNLVAGSQLWVPAVIPNTQVACIPGAVGWVKYVAQPGDNLYRIAVNYSTTLSTLKSVNCRTGDQLLAGEVLWVPNVATRTPTPTAMPGTTITPYPTEPLTQTPLPFTATVIPSSTPIPSTNTPVPTSTPIPTFTASPTPFPQQP